MNERNRSPEIEPKNINNSGGIYARYKKLSQMKEHPENLLLCEQTRPVRNELSLLFYYKAADQILLSKNKPRGIFFPGFRLHPDECVTKLVDKAISTVLENFDNIKVTANKMIRLVRLPIMNTKEEMIIVYTYLVYVDRIDNKSEPITDAKTIERSATLTESIWETMFECTYFWCERNNLFHYENKFWGPEVLKQSELAAEYCDKIDKLNLEIVHVCTEAIDDFFKTNDKLKSAKCFVQHTFNDQKILCALWNEWVFHTVPSTEMTIYSFERFLGKLSICSSSTKMEESFHRNCLNIYKAILSVARILVDTSQSEYCCDFEVIEHRITRTDYFQFLTLCVGLVLLDSNSPTFRFWEANMTFSFNYYSENRDKLIFTKFQEMAQETKLFLPKVLNIDEEKSCSTKNQNWIKLFWKRLQPSTDPVIGEYLTLANFKAFWDFSKKDRYEEVLCVLARSATFRSKHTNIIQTLQSRFMSLKYETSDLLDELMNGGAAPIEQTISKADLPDREPCSECQEQDFQMRLQRIKLDTECQIENIKMLEYFESWEEDEAKIGEEIFNIQALFYSQLEPAVMEQMLIKSRPEIVRSLEALKELYERTTSKIATINSPAVVLSAVHGNYKAIRKVCTNLFPTFPHNVPIGVVALGNYFEDNRGIETIITLLLAKLVQPAKVVLVRGRNDVFSIFDKTKCCHKLKDILGEEGYQLIVEIIEYMPMAVVIDDKIFASNCGMPLEIQKLENIAELNTPERIAQYKKYAHLQIFKGKPSFGRKDDDSNRKSGNSKSAFGSVISVASKDAPNKSVSKSKLMSFNSNDIDRFLKLNSLSYFIRNDSSLINEPFRVDDRVISLKSMHNDHEKKRSFSAYVCVDERRLQIVTFEF